MPIYDEEPGPRVRYAACVRFLYGADENVTGTEIAFFNLRIVSCCLLFLLNRAEGSFTWIDYPHLFLCSAPWCPAVYTV